MKMQNTSHKAGDYSRPNLNWHCGRDGNCEFGPTLNGKCSNTETPCIPQRSVKAKKRLTAIWLFSVLVGVLSVFLSASALLSNISPGPLSMSHEEVASCERCHTSANDDITDWVKKASTQIIGINDESGKHDDQQCLSCHTLGENAFLAHTTSADNFSHDASVEGLSSGSQSWKASIASTLHDFQNGDAEQISCSTCHKEHKGEPDPRGDFDSEKCHTCHEVKFDSFAGGHPEFKQFPYPEPTKINYDHSNHRGKYFSDKKYSDRAPQLCQDCHVTDQTGEWMLLNSFEETCSGCHLDDVLGMDRSSAKGIPVFIIPNLDIKTIAAAGYNIGEWPSSAAGELTPFMHTLLPSSFKKSSLLKSKTLALSDLSRANEEQLETAALLAWEIKLLFYELLLGGTAVFDHRLSNALGGESLDQSTMNRLIAALPKDTLLNNQKELFPNLMEELADYRVGKIKFKRDPNEPVIDPEASILDQSKEVIESVDETLSAVSKEITDAIGKRKKPAKVNKSLQGIPDMPDEEWAISGGWYREGSSILYRPIDHADLFFKTWLDLSASQLDMLDDTLFKSLSADKSVGNCTNCHTIQESDAPEVTQDGKAKKKSQHPIYKMNWLSFRPTDDKIDFDRFSHVTHFNKDCTSCHVVHTEPSVDRKKANLPPAPNVSVTGFQSMGKETCTECHQEDRAPDSCLTCHNYHAEPQRKRVEQIPDMPKVEK